MAELHQPRLLAKKQDLDKQIAQRRQMPLTELGDGAEIGPVETHNAHEIHPFQARLGDLARRVDAAAIRIYKQHCHHHRVKRWLTTLAAVGARDLREVDGFRHQVQDKAGQMVRTDEVLYHRRQQQRLIDLPRAKLVAHGSLITRNKSGVERTRRHLHSARYPFKNQSRLGLTIPISPYPQVKLSKVSSTLGVSEAHS